MSMNHRGELTTSGRPPAPWRASPAPINLSWHHLIPHAMMRNAWQALVHNQDLPKCRVALESYMRVLGVDAAREWLKALIGPGLSFDQQETLHRQLTWASWNIVEGPHYRTDDPKDDRSFDEFTAGLTASEWNRHRRVRDLFSGLQIFNQATAGGKFSEEAAMGVATVMNTVERSLVSGDLIRFRTAMWVEAKALHSDRAGMENVKWWKKKSGISFYERSAGA